MRDVAILLLAAPALSGVVIGEEEEITVSSELARMRSCDHLFRPQTHRIVQYSGFHRRGGNPDRMFCLYEENGWRVVADQRGPGVVTRIWTTHGTQWSEIQVEVDGEVLFTGNAREFFGQERIPFVRPLSEVRNSISGRVTAEQEAKGKKEWAVSYVPVPFKRRFRYLQREQVYANINIKQLPADTEVESFMDVDWKRLEPEIEKTVAVWENMNLYGTGLGEYEHIARFVRLSPSEPSGGRVVDLEAIDGPGIVRGIRVKADKAADYKDIDLSMSWDGEKTPSILSPLDHGFGSRQHRTLGAGQSDDGWRFLNLPMPFGEQARIALVSRVAEPTSLSVQLFVEAPARLPSDVLYLHSHANEGAFVKGQGKLAKPTLPLEDFFYEVGYTALDLHEAGHVVAYMDLFECQPELDEHVFIDDERTFPDNSWNGTGHEDLFDMAWGHKPLSSPMTSGGSQKFEEVNVKLFWNNPMTFRTAIRFNWELCFRYGIEAPRGARFASVVYWYGRRRPQSRARLRQRAPGVPTDSSAR